MQDSILAKLRPKLAGPPEDEADVVYVLVEIRKYLDHSDPDGDKFAVLRTYCDWPVHVLLDRGGAKRLIRSLNDAFAAPQAERSKALWEISNKFSLAEFQNELRLFLQLNDLPLVLVEDHVCWGQFVKHYVAVVSDCPIVYVEPSKDPDSIRKVTLVINEATKDLTKETGGVLNVVWAWELEFANGTRGSITNTYGYRLE